MRRRNAGGQDLRRSSSLAVDPGALRRAAARASAFSVRDWLLEVSGQEGAVPACVDAHAGGQESTRSSSLAVDPGARRRAAALARAQGVLGGLVVVSNQEGAVPAWSFWMDRP